MADDPRKSQLERELADCVMGASWFWCVAGVAAAVPIGVKTKSYLPVVFLGLGGTLLDLLQGYDKCTEQRQALERHLSGGKEGAPAGRGLASSLELDLELAQRRQQLQEARAAAAAAAAGRRPGE